MTTLLVLWLVVTVPLALLLGVIVAVQALCQARRHAIGRPARPVVERQPQRGESREAA